MVEIEDIRTYIVPVDFGEETLIVNLLKLWL